MVETDVVVVGYGPGGLTAAIYLARFHLRTIVIDSGNSRALMIPISHNHAGHPSGIAGRVLVDRMRVQALEYGSTIVQSTVTKIAFAEDGFSIKAGEPLRTRAILLATGVHNHRPAMDDALHAEAVAKGRVRYCPICDGYEVTDKRIAVIGSGSRGSREALFMRSFSNDITLVAPQGPHELDREQQAALTNAGVTIINGPATDFQISEEAISFVTAAGRQVFDTIYPALGSAVQSNLARHLGADLCEDDCIRVDSHQRTSVKGLYAAGDVVVGLDQISNAMGQAGVAATAIRNDLAAIRR